MSNNFQNFKVRGITLDNFFDTGPLKSANNDISFAFTISGSSENIFNVTPPLTTSSHVYTIRFPYSPERLAIILDETNKESWYVSGPIGFKYKGNDIGLYVAPKIYSGINTTRSKIITNTTLTRPNGVTHIGFYSASGGGGGQSGYARSGGGASGGSGGESGTAHFIVCRVNDPNTIGGEITIELGAGGAGGAQRTNNGPGNDGGVGGKTIIKYAGIDVVRLTGGKGGFNGTNNITTGNAGVEYCIGVSNNTHPNLSMVVQHNFGAAPSTDSILGAFWGGSGGWLTENIGGVLLQGDSYIATSNGYVNGGEGGRGDFSNDYGVGGTAGKPGAAYVFFYYR